MQPDRIERLTCVVCPLIDLSLKFFVCSRLLLLLLSLRNVTQTTFGAEQHTGSRDIITKQLQLHNAPCRRLALGSADTGAGRWDAREAQGL